MTSCVTPQVIACVATFDDGWLHVIAWAYLTTNAARLLTYMPQIVAVWRCRDGARSLSLLTWGSWVVSHTTAVMYGAVVTADHFLVVVSLINLACCLAVTVIASRRRLDWMRRAKAFAPVTPQAPGAAT